MNTDIQDFNALDNWSWAKQHNEDYLCAELRFLRIAAKQLQEARERLSCWLDALQNGVGTVKDVTRDHYKTNVVGNVTYFTYITHLNLAFFACACAGKFSRKKLSY